MDHGQAEVTDKETGKTWDQEVTIETGTNATVPGTTIGGAGRH